MEVSTRRLFITGCNGQLGRALVEKYPQATATSREELDISDADKLKAIDWSKYDVIINAAAYVNADKSETAEGRKLTWEVNAEGVSNLVATALENNLHLIHFSSEYVFDGTKENHVETEPFSPLSVYGQAKAAADLAVSLLSQYHILRTSWVVGNGHNFIKTMKNLADIRIDPKVVNDQFGRLTFTSELVRAVDHILQQKVPRGTYNVSNSGKIKSWAEIAADTFEIAGYERDRVKEITTDQYKQDKHPFAPRPMHSDMDLSKIQSTGFKSEDYEPLMVAYVKGLEEAK